MLMNMQESSCRSKRKRGEMIRVFGLQTFGDPGCPFDLNGPFRHNIRLFLQECAHREPYNVDGMPAWSITLQEGSHGDHISVFIIEEMIPQNSLHPHCDYCRCIGWSHHLVSNRRYHFIIPAENSSINGTGRQLVHAEKVCGNCHEALRPQQKICTTCGEKGVQESVLDLQTHLLHGMLHSNGFGHLMCLNGREKGSKYVSGRKIMDLWDRICAMLRARKVSVEDTAKKRSLELRLLHCVAYGESWFGRWGFNFGHGSFGVTQQMYHKAIEAIRGMPLSVMLQHFQGLSDRDVVLIVALYQRISGHALHTVGNLIRFMMELKSRLPLQYSKSAEATTKVCSTRPPQYAIPNPLPITADIPYCRWSVKRLELATQVIVEALKNVGEKKWMPRQDVRDAARVFIGDTGLLDFVLKSLGNRVVGGHIVRRAVNPITKVLQYSLEEVQSSTSATTNSKHYRCSRRCMDQSVNEVLSREDVWRDIVCLYKHVLEDYMPANNGMKNVLIAIPTATRIILDTKQLIKDYKGEMTRKCANNEWGMDDDEMLKVLCKVALKDVEPGSRNPPAPPPELLVLPPHATIGELKKEAERALRETYCIMHSFRVESIPGHDGDDDDLLFGALESGSTVLVEGSGVDMSSDLRYEGGIDTWTVDCPCGTKDDDGERMIACDVCEVWQHTRCGGISDMDAIPHLFLCNRCGLGLFQSIL